MPILSSINDMRGDNGPYFSPEPSARAAPRIMCDSLCSIVNDSNKSLRLLCLGTSFTSEQLIGTAIVRIEKNDAT